LSERAEQRAFEGTARFEIVRRLGEGGMGVVYEALDRDTGGRVALKTLRDVSADQVLRLKREFRAIVDLHHAQLVTPHALFEEGGRWFYTMELVDGTDFLSFVRPGGPSAPRLSTSIATAPDRPPTPRTDDSTPTADGLGEGHTTERILGALDEPALRRALPQVALGLRALHAAGMVHRDVKPSNVLVTRQGEVKILDFGLVREIGASARVAIVEGTAAYMAPEQAEGAESGAAADWYALGVMLYQALTGTLPFRGDFSSVVMAKIALPAPPVHTVAPDAPADLSVLADRLLARAPEERPGAAEVLAALHVEGVDLEEGGANREIVGRSAELAALHRALEASRREGAQLVVVEGESGVGKTALVQAFCRSLEGARVLSSRCQQHEAVPFKALDGIIDGLAELDAEADAPRAGLAELAAMFPVLRPDGARDVAASEGRARAATALAAWLAELGRVQPLVLVIDDAQWADADSLAFLADALRPPSPRVLLVMTCRPLLEGEASEGHAISAAELGEALRTAPTTLALGGLAPADAAALVQRLAGGALSASDASSLAGEAAGHPLFLDELVRRARASGDRPHAVALSDALRDRVAALPALEASLLRALAVAGGPTSAAILSHTLGQPIASFLDAALAMRAARLVKGSAATASDQLEPYHDRVRRAALEVAGPEGRRAMHQRLAAAYETLAPERAETLATHWAGAQAWAFAAHHAERAAERARRTLAFARAAEWFAQAAHAAERAGGKPAARVRTLLLARADALSDAGHSAEAAAIYLAQIDPRDEDEAFDLRRRAAEQYLRGGAIDEGLEVLRAVLAAVDLRMPESRAAVLAQLGYYRARLWLRGLDWTPRPIAAISAERLRRIDVCIAVASTLGLVDNLRATPLQTLSTIEALDAGEPVRVATTLALEAAFSSAAGQKSRAHTARVVERARACATQNGDPVSLAWAAAAEGYSSTLESRWTDAVDACARAERAFLGIGRGAAVELSTLRTFQVMALAYTGQLAELARLVPLRLADAESRGDLHSVLGNSTHLATMPLFAADRASEALARSEKALSLWSERDFHVEHWWALLSRTQARLYLGDGAVALADVDALWAPLKSSFLLEVELTRVEAHQMRARAALATVSAAPASSRRALLDRAARDGRMLVAEPCPWAAPAGALILAAVHHVRGEPATASQRIDEAVRGFEASAMPLYAIAARARRAQLAGDAATVSSERARLRDDYGVLAPERFLDMLAPWPERA
jgi:hypothetical protein